MNNWWAGSAMIGKRDSIDELAEMSRAIQHKSSAQDLVRTAHDKRKAKYNKKHDKQAGMPGMKMVFGQWKRKVFGKAMSNEKMVKAFAEQAVEEYNMQLSKGNARGGKYTKRVATGNPKHPYRYEYAEEKKRSQQKHDLLERRVHSETLNKPLIQGIYRAHAKKHKEKYGEYPKGYSHITGYHNAKQAATNRKLAEAHKIKHGVYPAGYDYATGHFPMSSLDEYGKSMDAIDQLGELAKGNPRGGKYFRRIATGNPKRPWKYYYTKEQYQKEHGDSAHLHGGDSVNATGSHPAGKQDEASWRKVAKEREGIASKHKAEGNKDMHDYWRGEAANAHKIADEHRAKGGAASDPDPGRRRPGDAEAEKKLWDKEHGGGSYFTDQWNKLHGGKKSMSNIPLSAQLSKGMATFTHEHKVRAEWLPEFVDAFIEEAHKHLSSEYRDPNLQKSFSTQDVFDEFAAYAKLNKSLAQAQASIPVTSEYVAQRLHELGLVPDSGYDPVRPLARNAGSPHTAAQAEQDEAVRNLGMLAKSAPGVVYADDGPDPFETLAKAQAQQSASLRKGYGSGSYATHDPACLFHGRDAHSQANEHTAMHGAVCTCG